MQAGRPRVLSGTPHLGNYLGALRRWAGQQDEKESYFCIVYMHVITRMTAFAGEGMSGHSGRSLVLWRPESQGWKIDRYVDITDLETRAERSG